MHKKTLSTSSFASFTTMLVILLSALVMGCENTSTIKGTSWTSPETSTPDTGSTGDSSVTTPGIPSAGDSVSFGSLNWVFGGFNGASAAHSGVNISSLSFQSDGLTFKYVNNLSAWGLSDSDHTGALACLFVQRSDGTWVGGKFDWISSSRTHRGFTGHVPGYVGWTLDGVPNPCQAAFVIVHVGGKKRSNVLTGTWTR